MSDTQDPKMLTPLQLRLRRAWALKMYHSDPHWRPVLRADCAVVPRPCPYVACRYNTALDITVWGGLRWRQKEAVEGPASGKDNCALDVAARGPQTLQEIANVTGVCRERVRQELDLALEKIKPFLRPNDVALERNDATVYDPAPEDAHMRAVGMDPQCPKTKHTYRQNLAAIDDPD